MERESCDLMWKQKQNDLRNAGILKVNVLFFFLFTRFLPWTYLCIVRGMTVEFEFRQVLFLAQTSLDLLVNQRKRTDV